MLRARLALARPASVRNVLHLPAALRDLQRFAAVCHASRLWARFGCNGGRRVRRSSVFDRAVSAGHAVSTGQSNARHAQRSRTAARARWLAACSARPHGRAPWRNSCCRTFCCWLRAHFGSIAWPPFCIASTIAERRFHCCIGARIAGSRLAERCARQPSVLASLLAAACSACSLSGPNGGSVCQQTDALPCEKSCVSSRARRVELSPLRLVALEFGTGRCALSCDRPCTHRAHSAGLLLHLICG